MDKLNALESIKQIWIDPQVELGEKILNISDAYYSTGLDLATTASYIHATPSELDALLSMGQFDGEIIQKISDANPPKTAWTFLSNATDEEVEQALISYKANNLEKESKSTQSYLGESVYYAMVDFSGPTVYQRVATLPGDTIKHALKKGIDFDIFSDWQKKFLTSLAQQKKRGKTLTDKQIKKLVECLILLVDKDAISRNSIDGDQAICDEILDALDR